MRKATLLKVVNPILGILFINQMLSPFYIRWLDMDRSWFKTLHKDAAYVLLAAVAVHIVLNWSWIKSTFLAKTKSQA